MVTEPQWYTKHPGQQIPNFLSHKDAATINQTINTTSAVDARNSTIRANQARVRSLDIRMKQQMANPDPNNLVDKQLKHLTNLVTISKNTSMEANVSDIVNKETPKLLKQMGYSDDDIQALTTASGGNWASRFYDWGKSALGLTAVDSEPSAQQPSTDHIHGVSTTIPAPAAAAANTPTTGGGTMTYDEWAKQNPRQ
jgi:hypothetical protein